ncbi:MAG: hypothetical protein GQ557_02055 [Mycoplasmataceae bacterium]|nr:hypothetical protein [Mycoplasmataceae bacterium]
MFQLTPQFWSIVVTTIFTVVISISLYYFVINKQDPNKEPKGLMVWLEYYVLGFNRLMDSMTGGKLRPAYAYLFTLMNFIIINELIVWFGWESPATSFLFTFTLGMITFIGIYIIGIGTMGLFHFMRHKYINPLELFSQFSPLISISVRLFGATFAGAIIGDIMFIVIDGLLGPGHDGFLSVYPAVSGLWDWIYRTIDTMLSLIQAFIFTVLTAVYWTQEHGGSWSPSERRQNRKEIKQQKKALIAKQKALEAKKK